MLRFLCCLFAFGLLFGGCSLTRRVPEGRYLYMGSELSLSSSEPEKNVRKLESTAWTLLENPAPNKRFLGVRWGLRFYNLFYTEKKKGLKAWLLGKLGEPPVLYDERINRQTERLLEDLSANEGFFRSEAGSEAILREGKAKVEYRLELTPPYTIDACTRSIQGEDLRREVDAVMGGSLLGPGMRYELKRLVDERERIAAALRDRGYYYFQGDFLKFRADTTRGDRRVRLDLQIKPEVASLNLKPQTIERVTVYPDFQFGGAPGIVLDTVRQNELTFFFQNLEVEPEVLSKAILLRPGRRYAPEDHRNTLRRLSLLTFYQFIDIQYETGGADTLLRAKIYLTPRKKYTVEGSAGLSVRSSAYIGPEFSLDFIDRNFRDRAEQLRLRTFGVFNVPLNDAFRSYQELGASAQILRQGLNFPFNRKPTPANVVGQTRIKLDYGREQVRLPLKNLRAELEEQKLDELLARLDADSTYAPYARINRFDASYAYQWITRPDIRHELTPLQVILQDANFENGQLRSFLTDRDVFSNTRGAFLNLERMLIFKPNYILTYDSRLKQLRRHNYFNRSKAAISGNLLLTKEDIFTLRSLQTLFVQLENDWRYYFQSHSRQTWAFRLASSVAIPFRRGAVLPFIDLYNVGGANSIRAFPPRQVGPGAVEPTEETFFLASNGDLKLEGSVELRQKLTSLFELALFVDAGNVWDLQRREDVNEDALFRWDSFYRQIAMGAGVGLRLDFEVLLLRLDFAIPLLVPWRPEGERWVGGKISPGSAAWRKDNLNFSLAFGYPF